MTKLEQGDREPSWATVQALARALGVSCEAFQGKDGPAETKTAPKKEKKRKGEKDG